MINLAYNLANIINTRNSTNHKNLLNSNPKTFPVSVREKEGLSINRRGSRNISKSKEGVMGILDVWTTCTLAGFFRGRGIGGWLHRNSTYVQEVQAAKHSETPFFSLNKHKRKRKISLGIGVLVLLEYRHYKHKMQNYIYSKPLINVKCVCRLLSFSHVWLIRGFNSCTKKK